jgi:predicted DNA-binding transcriptional regulator AlpA
VTGRLLSTRELSEYLGLSPEAVLRRWRRGEIPGGIRLSSNVLRFREQAIEAWLAGLEERDQPEVNSLPPADGGSTVGAS